MGDSRMGQAVVGLEERLGMLILGHFARSRKTCATVFLVSLSLSGVTSLNAHLIMHQPCDLVND